MAYLLYKAHLICFTGTFKKVSKFMYLCQCSVYHASWLCQALKCYWCWIRVCLLQVVETCTPPKYKGSTDSEIQLRKHLKLSEINSTAYTGSFSEVACSKSVCSCDGDEGTGFYGWEQSQQLVLLFSVTLPLNTSSSFGQPVQEPCW